MQNKKTRISIITVVKNDPCGLKETLESVQQQSHNDYEYLIIDGSDNDAISEIVSSFSGFVKYYDKSVDRGISHAFNKGILAANGLYILMLNAGDTLIGKNALKYAEKYFTDGMNIVSFGVYSEELGKNIIPIFFNANGIPHQGLFVGHSVYDLIGGYNEIYKFRMDYDFLLRAIKSKVNLVLAKEVISKYRQGGVSSSISNRVTFYQEEIRANIKNRMVPNYWSIGALAYWAIRSAISI